MGGSRLTLFPKIIVFLGFSYPRLVVGSPSLGLDCWMLPQDAPGCWPVSPQGYTPMITGGFVPM